MLDPTAVGFAYGGVLPGNLHSKGVLHETHRCYFSVGRVGRYLLHVRLRQAGQAVPGSPFGLTVIPGVAFHATSWVERPASTSPASTSPAPSEGALGGGALVGEVGLQPTDGCSVLLRTSDRSGNLCVNGGAKVSIVCPVTSVQATVMDHEDGTYLVTFTPPTAGKYRIDAALNKKDVNAPKREVAILVCGWRAKWNSSTTALRARVDDLAQQLTVGQAGGRG